MIQNIDKELTSLFPELKTLNEFIYANPELGNQEYKAAKAHVELLEKHGFHVTENYMDIPTAFLAVYKTEKPGAKIAFFSEYDALPGIGHGCAHNLLGTTSTGSAIVLSKLINSVGGEISVFGTPAEESDGAKVPMAENAAFDDFDAALMAHPGDKHHLSGRSLAMEAVAFKFFGKTAHAAAAPEKGINALDACINFFNNVNSLRQHIRSDARIHGIITHGGDAANIVPDYAEARFYIRASNKAYLQELSIKVKRCAEGASLAAGARMEWEHYENSFDDLQTNETLNHVYKKNLELCGVKEVFAPRESFGSLDAGNVSYHCPTIHPYFQITDYETPAHTREFRDASITKRAYQGLTECISALVLTSLDVLTDQELRKAIREEFEKNNF